MRSRRRRAQRRQARRDVEVVRDSQRKSRISSAYRSIIVSPEVLQRDGSYNRAARCKPTLPSKTSRSTFVRIRDADYHLREWGDPDAPLIVMLHGWMDVSASFQFLVDALAGDWHVVAPDWRGFGRTSWSRPAATGCPSTLRDLDARPRARVVGALGQARRAQPRRQHRDDVCRRPTRADRAARQPRRTRHGRRRGRQGAGAAREVARRAARPADACRTIRRRRRSRLVCARRTLACREDRADFLAAHWSEPTDDGRFRILGDPAHKVVNPYLYRADEVVACWAAIIAPVLWIMARDSDYAKRMDALPGYAERIHRSHASSGCGSTTRATCCITTSRNDSRPRSSDSSR